MGYALTMVLKIQTTNIASLPFTATREWSQGPCCLWAWKQWYVVFPNQAWDVAEQLQAAMDW